MQSTFSGIELGKRGLIGHTQGLQTVGHNLSNASTEGYSRQRVEMKPTDALYMPGLSREETPGQIGQGTDVASITRVRDELLEGRLVAQANGEGYWSAKDKYILMLEKVYNEPGDVSVRALMDNYWSGWQELSLHPTEMGSRSAVLERGEALIDAIHERYYGLKRTRDMIEEDIKVTVGQVNSLTSDIAVLNERILKVKAMGDNPNDLLDRRDLLVERLSGIINITVDKRDPDEFVVHTSGFHIVQGKNFRSLGTEGNPNNEGYVRVFWERGMEDLQVRGGKLAALLELRDGEVRSEIQNLDMMTVNFIDLVNEIHRSGYGLNEKTNIDFFVEYPAINNLAGNYDRNGDGEYDSSYIFRITGGNSLNPQENIGLRGEMVFSGPRGDVRIPYHPSDTVEDVVARINNSGAEVTARLDRDGKLSLKGTPAQDPAFPDFVIRRVEDSGHFLAGYSGILIRPGAEGAFDWGRPDAVLALRGGDLAYAVAPLAHPSAWIEVNRELRLEPASIAAAFGEAGRPGKPGDGSAALAVASLRNHSVMIGKTTTFDNYFADTVAAIGLKGEKADIALRTQEQIMKDLRDMRESISGVNIDEELSNMIKFQHGYAAVARFISEYTKMLDTIINRIGV
jgi:flagellar hook-associated protein 1 FlgK